MTFAVHSLHAPPVEIDERNRYSLTEGRDWIQGSEPIHTADTKEEAEQWQAERSAALCGTNSLIGDKIHFPLA